MFTIKATLGQALTQDASPPKAPLCGAGSLIVSRNGEMHQAIIVRTYYNPKGSGLQPVYASVWIAGMKAHYCGAGSARSCGYHKESAAIANAVEAAGVTLFGNPYGSGKSDPTVEFRFGGTGDSAYPDIFKAIARAAGYRGRMLWVSHGL